jgi:hypothetical protein
MLDRIPAGNQVFLNYGSKGNEELLKFYGFALSDNPVQTALLERHPVITPEVWSSTSVLSEDLDAAKQEALQAYISSLILADFWVGRKAAAPKLLDMYRLMCVDEKVHMYI